jgi:hypothetical protein
MRLVQLSLRFGFALMASLMGCLLIPILDRNDFIARYGKDYSVWTVFDMSNSGNILGVFLYGGAMLFGILAMERFLRPRLSTIPALGLSMILGIPVGLLGMAGGALICFALYYGLFH